MPTNLLKEVVWKSKTHLLFPAIESQPLPISQLPTSVQHAIPVLNEGALTVGTVMPRGHLPLHNIRVYVKSSVFYKKELVEM